MYMERCNEALQYVSSPARQDAGDAAALFGASTLIYTLYSVYSVCACVRVCVCAYVRFCMVASSACVCEWQPVACVCAQVAPRGTCRRQEECLFLICQNTKQIRNRDEIHNIFFMKLGPAAHELRHRQSL